MKKIKFGGILIAFFFAACQPASESELYEQGQYLVDSYHGETQKLKDAALIFEKIIKKNPKSVYGITGIGRVCYKAGYISGDDYHIEALKAAQNIFKEAIESDPTFFDAYYYNAYAYLFEKDFANARLMIYNAKAINSTTPKLNLIRAHLAYHEDNYDEALIQAKIVSDKSDDIFLKESAYRILATINKLKHNNTEAEFYYKEIIKLDEGSPWAYHNYAIFLKNVGRLDESIENSEKALSIMNFGAARSVLASSYQKKGNEFYEKKDFLSARKYYELSSKLDSENPYTLYGLGMTYYYTGHSGKNVSELLKAKGFLGEAVRLKNNFTEAHEQLANLNNLLAYLNVN